MAANINDKFNQATTTGRPSPAALTAVKTIGATSITVDSTTEWPTDTAVHFIIYEVDANNDRVEGTQCDFKGVVNSATTINNLTLKAGTDREYSIGSKVICAPTAAWADDVVEGLVVSLNQDGTLKDNAVVTANITDASVTGEKLGTPVAFRAHQTGSGQVVTTGVATKVIFNSENFDLGANFDNATDYDFNAPYTGIYRFEARVGFPSTVNRVIVDIYVNGSNASRGIDNESGRLGLNADTLSLTAGDLVEVYVTHTKGSSATINASTSQTSFSGSLIGTTA